MDTIASAITNFFNATGADLSQFLGSITLIGTATMALIQAAKDTTPLRQWYQRHRVRKWLRQGAIDAANNHRQVIADARLSERDARPFKLQEDASAPVDVSDLEREIVRLAVDGDDGALYDLSIEQLCGQLNTAMQVVIDYPGRHIPLLLVAASSADTDDVKTLITTTGSQFDPANPNPAATAARVKYADARNRVSHQVQRAIDGFQIAAAFRWKWILQLTSFAVSALLAAIALRVGSSGVSNSLASLSIVGTAILAGFLAPVARDLTAALQKLRTA